MQWIKRNTMLLALASVFGAATTTAAAAQSASTIESVRACYVPGSGTIYRVKTAKAPSACVGADHVEFTLGDTPVALAAGKPGSSDPIDHGSLTGLLDDDHPQYLPADGARTTRSGFAVTGYDAAGSIPASGPGTRVMWVARKAAFRAGRVTTDQWDEPNIGDASTATGIDTKAIGFGSVAMGNRAAATVPGSVAIGTNLTAAGERSVALGSYSSAVGNDAVTIGTSAQAWGTSAVAIGQSVVATAPHSVALGYNVNTQNQNGTVVISARMPTGDDMLIPAAPSQFVARANRFWFGNNTNVTALPGQLIATSTGAHLTTGGTWVNSSDVNSKEHFASVNGEDVLDKLATLSIQSWNYRDEDSTVRHIGPTAQDFRSAYGLGASETTIATVDADGITLAAAQALGRRTREQAGEIADLRERLREQAAALEELRSALTASRNERRRKH
jgi:hypothetical protein